MKKIIKGAACALTTFLLGATFAWADVSYRLYATNGGYAIDQITIQDDVNIDGVTYSAWLVEGANMTLYVPTDAAYVTMDANSPVIGKPFRGGWVSNRTASDLGDAVCSEPVTDHNGTSRPLWGTLTWTITSLATSYDFEIKLGECGKADGSYATTVGK